MAKKNSLWEDYTYNFFIENGIEEAIREYRFHSTRRWRFDLAILSKNIAIEVDGGIFSGGRHVRPIGYQKDCEKYNEAIILGWKVFRITPQMINQGWLERILDYVKA